MANANHIKILKEGVKAWNKWRNDNPDIKPELENADLSGLNLRKVNLENSLLCNTDLSNTNLGKSNLINSDLKNANLSNAYLNAANLSGSKLDNANLSKTSLINANLSQATLIKTTLYKTIFKEANLENADLHETSLEEVNFVEANLAEVNLVNATFYRPKLIQANLSNAKLTGANLYRANLIKATLDNADLRNTDIRHGLLRKAKLIGTDLSNSNLSNASFSRATLCNSKLIEADLSYANFRKADLHGANLLNAKLIEVNFVEASLEQAILSGCYVYGISAWGLNLKNTIQNNLIISRDNEPTVTVDNLDIAQFIYLLIHNEKIREAIDTITSKAVLILGRFTPERKAILDAIRDTLRNHNLLPILFDFDKPNSRDLSETISTLAHMSRFIIADITDARSIPQELQIIIPNLPSVVIQPLLHTSSNEYSMFEHFKNYPWVLDTFHYTEIQEVIDLLTKTTIPYTHQYN